MWQMSPFSQATSIRGYLDVICFAGIMRHLASLLSVCSGHINKGLLAVKEVRLHCGRPDGAAAAH